MKPIEAAGAGNFRYHCRQLQEAAQAAGSARREGTRQQIAFPAQERRYRELRDTIIRSVKSLSLNQNRIDALVEQLSTSTSGWWASRASCCALQNPMA